jgi:hypothetical protein
MVNQGDQLQRLVDRTEIVDIIVTISADAATCHSAYRIFRFDPLRAPGENRLDTAGAYEHGLVRTPQGWRIDRIRQTVLIQEGNPLVHGGLARRVVK